MQAPAFGRGFFYAFDAPDRTNISIIKLSFQHYVSGLMIRSQHIVVAEKRSKKTATVKELTAAAEINARVQGAFKAIKN